MDVRRIFQAASTKLMADFEESAAIQHSGGKGAAREDALSVFMRDKLPRRYDIGRGEVVNSENHTSGQMDLIIYDPYECPKIISSPSHSVFPVESVYGAISIKSTLAKRDLEDAYKNIASLHHIVDRDGFQHGGFGFISGISYPRPFTAVFAYRTERSLGIIADQVAELDGSLPSLNDRPDYVCILGVGIIGPRSPMRGDFNKLTFPVEEKDIRAIRKAGRHTLFQLYIHMLREMARLKLRPLDLSRYEDLPALVGSHRVRRHDNFARLRQDGPQPTLASRLTKTAIELIVSQSVLMTRVQAIAAMTNAKLPEPIGNEFAGNVYCYNPRNLPPIDSAYVSEINNGERPAREVFLAHILQIDGVDYFVDMGSLKEEHFELNPDMTYDELLS